MRRLMDAILVDLKVCEGNCKKGAYMSNGEQLETPSSFVGLSTGKFYPLGLMYRASGLNLVCGTFMCQARNCAVLRGH